MKKILLALMTIISTNVMAQTNFSDISFSEALVAASQEGKQVFIDFYTDWCGPCKRMSRETFPKESVGEYMNKHFVNLKINAEKGEGVELAKKYNITAYPTFVVLDAKGNECGRCLGFRDADAFIGELDKMRDPELRSDRLVARYNSGERNAKLIKAYAAYLKESRVNSDNTVEAWFKTRDMVNKMVQNYFDSLTDAQKIDKENLFVYRTYTASIEESPAKYIVANRNKFIPELKSQVDSIIHELYDMQLYWYLSGHTSCDAKKLKAIKNDIKKLNIDNNGKMKAALLFLEPKNQQPDELANAITKYFNQLDERHVAALMDGMTRRFSSAPQATKDKLALTLRKQLPTMSLESLFTAIMTIPELEGKRGH